MRSEVREGEKGLIMTTIAQLESGRPKKPKELILNRKVILLTKEQVEFVRDLTSRKGFISFSDSIRMLINKEIDAAVQRGELL